MPLVISTLTTKGWEGEKYHFLIYQCLRRRKLLSAKWKLMFVFSIFQGFYCQDLHSLSIFRIRPQPPSPSDGKRICMRIGSLSLGGW